ncbi:MAG: penicillin acylase family protein [Caldilineaceae bacterium]
MTTTMLIDIFAVLLLLVLAVGGFLLYIYWWSIQRATPALDGEMNIPGLAQSVEIRRDRHGVPHIYAQNRADLFRAQGFVHAQDRLWQMEQNRRIARGALAAVFGEAALEADRFSRIVGFWRAAQVELTTLDAETRQVLDWYAEGVNAYIRLRPNRLAAEFNLLRIQPEPWSALDTLGYAKVTAWGLSLNWESELTRLRLLEGLDPVVAAELDPDYVAKNPIILEGVGSAEVTRMLSTAGLLLNQYEQLKQWLGAAASGQGSNSWVLAPKNSLNRRPLLCNDPHLAISIPGVWYENHLSCPGYEVSGVSFTGAPGIVIGHNEEIAWGMTNAMLDVQDLYVERAHPHNPTLFEYAGQWEQAQVIDEVIQVRRGQPHTERVMLTRHGPLISGLIHQERRAAGSQPTVPLSLRWLGHEPGQLVRAMLKLNQATTWEEFNAALDDWSAPAQNITFADGRGNIGYRLAGQAPIRDKNLGLAPAPGWTTDYEWSGVIPVNELPRLYNPPSGKIVTANNKIVGDEYPYFLGVEFDPGWRAARLEELLTAKERYTIRDMEAIQLDTLSKYAQALTPWLTLYNSDDEWEMVAVNELRKWNFRMDSETVAALVFHYYLLNLLRMTFGDKLGPATRGYLGIASNPLFLIHGFQLRAQTKLLELLNEQEKSIWYMDAASGRQRTRDELLQEALTTAIKQIRENHGDSKLKWNWGRAHQIQYPHPLGSVRLVRNLFNRGPLPIGGDGTTPNVSSYAPQLPMGLTQVIASYRQIYEVGTWDRAQTITTSGQSGHPFSPHYDDQIMMWREGVYHKMLWSREEVERLTMYRLLLKPPQS